MLPSEITYKDLQVRLQVLGCCLADKTALYNEALELGKNCKDKLEKLAYANSLFRTMMEYNTSLVLIPEITVDNIVIQEEVVYESQADNNCISIEQADIIFQYLQDYCHDCFREYGYYDTGILPSNDSGGWVGSSGIYVVSRQVQSNWTQTDIDAVDYIRNKSINGYIEEGNNITITGEGTLDDPYVITSSGGGGSADTGDIRFISSWIKNVDDGNIFISPQDGTTWLTLPSDTQAAAGAYVQLASVDPDSEGIYLTTNNGTSNNNWKFRNDGVLESPGRISFGDINFQSIGIGNVSAHAGYYGVSLYCSVGYELNWQEGYLAARQPNSPYDLRPIYLDSLMEYSSDLSGDYTDRSLIDKGYLTSQNYLTSISGITAGGDLEGTYTDPKVIKLRGNSISSASPTAGQTLQWNGTEWAPGAVPTGGSGGGGISYYFNYQNTTDITPTTGLPTSPVAVSQLGINYSTGSGSIDSANLTQGSYTLVCGFVTIVGTPGITTIPAGLWDFNIWADVVGGTGSSNQTQFQIRIYKYASSTGTYTLLAQSDDIYIYDPSVVAQYIGNVTMPQTTILSTDRIYIEFWAQKNVNQSRQISFHFDSAHPSHVHTTIPSVAGTGLVKAVNGVFQSPASTLVDADVSASAAIAVSKLSMATNKLLGRTTASTGSVEELTGTQATALLDNFTSSLKGLAPSSGGGTTNFLRADGTWADPGGGMTNPMTTLGDVIYGGASGTATRLAGDTSGTKKFLSTQSSGGVATAPTWNTVSASDISGLTVVNRMSVPSDLSTITTTSLTDITGLSFTASPNKTYEIWGTIFASNSGNASTRGVGFAVSSPSGTVKLGVTGAGPTGVFNTNVVSSNNTITATGFGNLGTQYMYVINCTLVTGGTGGTVQFKYASKTSGDTSAIYGGSWLKYTEN